MKKIIFKILILIMISIIISCSNENSGTKKENIQLSENEKLQVFDIRYLTSENGEYLYIISEENSKKAFINYTFYTNQSIDGFVFDTEINDGYIGAKMPHDNGTATMTGNLSDAGFSGKIYDREVNFVNAKSPLSEAKIVRYSYTVSPTNASEEDIKTFEYYSSIFLFNNDSKSAIIDKINLDINSEITSEKLYINKLSDIKNILSNNMLPFYNDWADEGEYGYGYNYYSISEYGIDYLSEKIASINKYFYEYTGGAHGVHEKIYKVYSLSNGERLKIEDILIDVNNLDLINKVKEKLLSNADEESYFNLDGLSLQENNFYITSKGLTFTWGIYEIAPYATGDSEVLFSIDEIMPYLKDEYKSIFE